MIDIERAGAFYLGKEYDLESGQVLDKPVMYDARDLTTHAVCLGMTGSGKTGLCIDLLEEATLDGVPSIIIDPKGDVTNLLLTFPDLLPADFEPWINADDARRKGMSVPEYAAKTAQTWTDGLAQWEQGPERIQRLRDSAEFLIYTPGSETGIPVSILQSLRCPSLSWDMNEELLRDKVSGLVSAILGLAGIEAGVRSREHILMASIVEEAWRRSQDVDFPSLIKAIQDPPMSKVGVFDVDTFFPKKERFELALALNNIIAAPSFENWVEGVPLEMERIVRSPDGKPRVSIFYIAHLTEAERMFFVTLLLEQVITWMHTLSGTTSLRALIYFDEVFGYFPPHPVNPPSKRPLLTLLKTARAFGLGVVLTTQNPFDLDYKGLTNAGTWFIGKLQTDRDKMRVLEGMDGVVAEAGTLLDRSYLDRLISSLRSRVFILHNVHEDRPIVFNTRWAMSYLRGPLTRRQVKELMKDVKKGVSGDVERAVPARAAAVVEEALPQGLSSEPPVLPPRTRQYFLPTSIPVERAVGALQDERGRPVILKEHHLIYSPYILGLAAVRFSDRKSGATHLVRVARKGVLSEELGSVDWDQAEEFTLDKGDLTARPFRDALFAEMPALPGGSKELTQMKTDFANHIYDTVRLTVLYNPVLKVYGKPGESLHDFKVRCQDAARAKRDEEGDTVETHYMKKLESLFNKLKKEKQELGMDQDEYTGRKREEMLSAGESVLGFFLGRRSSRAVSVASRKRRLTEKAKMDVEESVDEIEDLEQAIEELKKEMQETLDEVTQRWAATLDEVEDVEIQPTKTNIRVEAFGVAWTPGWYLVYENDRGTEVIEVVPAMES